MIYKNLTIDEKIMVKSSRCTIASMWIKHPKHKTWLWLCDKTVIKYIKNKYFSENQNLQKPEVKKTIQTTLF